MWPDKTIFHQLGYFSGRIETVLEEMKWPKMATFWAFFHFYLYRDVQNIVCCRFWCFWYDQNILALFIRRLFWLLFPKSWAIIFNLLVTLLLTLKITSMSKVMSSNPGRGLKIFQKMFFSLSPFLFICSVYSLTSKDFCENAFLIFLALAPQHT